MACSKVMSALYSTVQSRAKTNSVGLKRILVLFDYSIVLTVFECYCNYSNIRLESFNSW